MARGGDKPRRREPHHRADRAGGQRRDRGRQGGRRAALGLVGDARRGRALGRGHDQPDLPALLAGGRRARARRRPPLRRRQERFFWSFLAAVGIFVAGAGFSLDEGLHRIFGPTEQGGSYGIAYAVLAFSFLADGFSLLRACRQTRREAADKDQSHVGYVKRAATRRPRRSCSRTPPRSPASCSPRSAWAAPAHGQPGLRRRGVGRHRRAADDRRVHPRARHEVAAGGSSATPEERQAICSILDARPEVDRVVELLTMALAPSSCSSPRASTSRTA